MKTKGFVVAVLVMTLGCPFFAVAQEEKPQSVSATAAIVMDSATGTVLFEKNADQKRAMASTTKIMTTLLTLEQADLKKEIVTTEEMVRVEGSGMGLLPGDTVTYEALCYGMMLASGNDAANTVAISLAGSLEAFADRMNAKAAFLGMNNTHFVTPSGLDDDLHYSTAYDMAVLAAYALKSEQFCKIAASSTAAVSYGNPPYRRTLTNHNKLLESYPGCVGMKTGFTKKAGRCLVSAATRNGATLICVTLSAPDDWNDHQKLLDYGFSRMETVTAKGGTVTLPVVGGVQTQTQLTYEAVSFCVPTARKEEVSVQLRVSPFLYAPIAAGQQVGEYTLLLDGQPVISTPVVAVTGAEQIPFKPGFWERLWLGIRGIFT